MDNTKDVYGYLMVHFVGEEVDGEQVYFSVSEDGLHWKDLHKGKEILCSTIGDQGVRDPFIFRTVDGESYYIIATDLKIAGHRSWQEAVTVGSRSILLWESKDLIHWIKERLISVGVAEAGCVWAPEVIYDEEEKNYLIFFASMVNLSGDKEPKHRIYSVRTKDFLTFSEAEVYIERENHIIDTTIIKNGDYYYRFSKDETMKNISCDRGKNLSGPFHKVSIPVLESLHGVEGPAAIYLANRGEWCLMVDQFAEHKGYLPILSKDLNPDSFRILKKSEYDLGEGKKRHGSLLSLCKEEYNRLIAYYGF